MHKNAQNLIKKLNNLKAIDADDDFDLPPPPPPPTTSGSGIGGGYNIQQPLILDYQDPQNIQYIDSTKQYQHQHQHQQQHSYILPINMEVSIKQTKEVKTPITNVDDEFKRKVSMQIVYKMYFYPNFIMFHLVFQKHQIDDAYFIAKELLMTERTYKKDLELVIIHFRNHFNGNLNTFSESLDTLIYSNLDPIYEFHVQFLKDLEVYLANW